MQGLFFFQNLGLFFFLLKVDVSHYVEPCKVFVFLKPCNVFLLQKVFSFVKPCFSKLRSGFFFWENVVISCFVYLCTVSLAHLHRATR